MLLIGTPSARFWQFHSKITPAWTRELQLNLILIFSNLCRTVSGQVNVFCARLENGASVLGNRLTGENSGTSFVCGSFRFSAIEWRRVIARQFNYVRWNLFLVIFPAQDIQMMFSWNVRWKLIIRSSANLWVKIGVVFDLPFWIWRRGFFNVRSNQSQVSNLREPMNKTKLPCNKDTLTITRSQTWHVWVSV